MFKHLAIASALFVVGLSAAQAAPTTYTMDPNHTDVVAQWNHFGFSNPKIHFGDVSGAIVYDPDNIKSSSVKVSIPMSSMSSRVSAFDDHLRTDELFDVSRYPSIEFQSTSVSSAGPGKLKVDGVLTLRGISKPVVLDVVLNGQGSHPMTKAPAIGFDATTTLRRTDFGLGLYAPAVADEVFISITTEATVPSP